MALTTDTSAGQAAVIPPAAPNGDDEKTAVERLQREADAGDVAAMTALGERLLTGRGIAMSPFDGATMLVEASKKGGAIAAKRVAVLCGAGACTPQSWPLAFDHLLLAAERGDASARGQIALLSSDAELAAHARSGVAEDGIWRKLRDAIDLARLTAAPPMRVISANPRIAVVEKFADETICHWLIERARPILKPARVYGKDAPGSRLENARTNSDADFDILQTDVPVLIVRERMAAATRIPATAMENTAVLHYSIGQQFRRHFDFLEPNLPAHAEDLQRRGQRILTFLVYLNDGYEGGETEFPLLDLRYKGKRGDALCFRNVEPSGAPDRKTLHAGLAPTAGEKWLLSQWIRGVAR
jgi:hypothetical protein